MREIKFRAWDGNRMHFSELLGCDIFESWSGQVREATALDERCDVMQYTGLKDKNGKEIYEGDVVKQNDRASKYNGGIGVVEFAINNSVGYPINGFWANVSSDEAFTLDSRYVEIIGNIYENPDLLK